MAEKHQDQQRRHPQSERPKRPWGRLGRGPHSPQLTAACYKQATVQPRPKPDGGSVFWLNTVFRAHPIVRTSGCRRRGSQHRFIR